ncbi:MAG TPA: hypothetical protein VE987_02390 [Polyangiaceae bacterium]|nr:hypothetical protein [Polyangiaceae bacterium]
MTARGYRLCQLAVALCTACLSLVGPGAAAVCLAAAPERASAAPEQAARMDQAIAELASDSVERRRAAAAALSAAPVAPGGVEAIGQALAELRRGEGRDPPPPPAPPRVGSREVDAVELLLEQPPDASSQRTLAIVCLMRSLARVATTAAVEQLVPMATSASPTIRAELAREVKQLDERATAALVEAKADASPDIRLWAKDTLDAIGKRTPGDAVQTTDDQVLVDVLHAYADTGDVDAVPVVVSFVNSDRAPVRAAAREATLAYGRDAFSKIRSTYAALTGERLPEEMDAAEAAHMLFDAYDHERLRDVYARLDDGLAKQRAGDLDQAIAAFDEVLARQPMLDRRAEMAPAYVARAAALEATDPTRAIDALRRARRLEASKEAADRVESEIAYLEAQDLLSRGVADPTLLEQALALDPTNERARSALDRLRSAEQSALRRDALVGGAAGAAGFGLIAVGLVALVMTRRGPRAVRSSRPYRPRSRAR